MYDETIDCRCGRKATTVIVIYGCIIEKCFSCAAAMCDPLHSRIDEDSFICYYENYE